MDLPDSPGPIKAAALLVACEALALVGFAIAELFVLDADRLALGLTNAVFFALYGAGLALCAWGLLNLRRWCRSPIVLTQFIQLGVAYSFVGGDTTWLSVVLAVVAIAVLLVIFAPSTTAALYGIRDGTTTQGDQPE